MAYKYLQISTRTSQNNSSKCISFVLLSFTEIILFKTINRPY